MPDNPKPRVEIYYTPEFKRNVRALVRKYPHIRTDIQTTGILKLLNWHLIPRAALQNSACFFLLFSTPLFKEKWELWLSGTDLVYL